MTTIVIAERQVGFEDGLWEAEVEPHVAASIVPLPDDVVLRLTSWIAGDVHMTSTSLSISGDAQALVELFRGCLRAVGES